VDRDTVESCKKASANLVTDRSLPQLPGGAEEDHYKALMIISHGLNSKQQPPK